MAGSGHLPRDLAHEYVVIERDGQQELLAAFCRRILRGEGVDCRFFHQQRKYLFLGEYKYWTMDEVEDIDPETYDGVLNRARLFKDRRDFIIRRSNTAKREECKPESTERRAPGQRPEAARRRSRASGIMVLKQKTGPGTRSTQ